MDYTDTKKKSNFVGNILLAATLTGLCILMFKQRPNFGTPCEVGFVHSFISFAIKFNPPFLYLLVEDSDLGLK